MNPGSTQTMVLEVLQQASSQNPTTLKLAEAKLSEWEIQAGFYTALYDVINNHSLEVNIRLMAVLCLKNGVDKYWRKNAPNAMSEDEKQRLKQALSTHFQEPSNQVALHIAILISKIARMDCPKEWPMLLPTLVQAIDSNDILIQHRSLLTLHHVVKALSSKRLLGDKHAFHEFAANLYPFVLKLWNHFSDQYVSCIIQNGSTSLLSNVLDKALLSVRILRKLTIYGFYDPNENSDCMTLIKSVFDRLRTALECRCSIANLPILPQCEKYIIQLTKILHSVLEVHPYLFIEFIQPSLELVYYYLFTSSNTELLFERFNIQCFNLMRNILICVEYKPSKAIKATKGSEMMRAHQIIEQFFRPEVLAVISKKLVSQYFILKQEDLELWDADPEAFVIDEGGDSWKYSIRLSMEQLFRALFSRSRKVLVPIILDMVRDTMGIVPPNDMEGILKKDAVYNAVGLADYNMYDEVDFDQWFTNTLTQEVKIKHNNYRIIRRRVSWLFGIWTSIKLATELRPALYDCVLSLLDPAEDMAVRLTAAFTLRSAIDDFEFSSEQFQPFMNDTFLRLFDLLKTAAECETKMQVLSVIVLMIERCGQSIGSNSDILIQYLPLLWQESEEHNMLRCGIVATFAELVNVGCLNANISEFLTQVINLGTDIRQSASLYLLEDCLELWGAILNHSKTLTIGCMHLFDNIIPLLDHSTENWKTLIDIIRRYLLIDPEFVLGNRGLQVINLLDSLMSDLRMEALVVLARLFESFVCISPLMGAETIKVVIPRLIISILAKDDPMGNGYETYFAVVSRFILASHQLFSQTLQEVARRTNSNEQFVLGGLIDVWTEMMPDVAKTSNMKLLGMALTNILTIRSDPIIHRIPRMLINICETLNDVMQTDEEGVAYDSLILSSEGNETAEGPYIENEHDYRESQLILIDPVHNVVLKDYLQSQLLELKLQLGVQHYQQLVEAIDHNTLTQLQDYITF